MDQQEQNQKAAMDEHLWELWGTVVICRRCPLWVTALRAPNRAVGVWDDIRIYSTDWGETWQKLREEPLCSAPGACATGCKEGP
jgi:hypothetical protein